MVVFSCSECNVFCDHERKLKKFFEFLPISVTNRQKAEIYAFGSDENWITVKYTAIFWAATERA